VASFEYLLLFASVVLGLAVCEIAIGLNRLLSNWTLVRWDWLAPLAALVTFLKIVTQWWSWHGAIALASAVTFELYLAVLAGVVLLFMMAAAALPTAAHNGEPIDLRDHYARISRRFWLIFSLHFIVAVGAGEWLTARFEHARFALSPAFLLVPLALLLAFWRNRILHTLALVGFSLLYLFQYFGQPLP
jgi:hypothetical protein